jgi:hypothetical protein
MPFPREEVEGAVAAYVALRERIEAGDATWIDLTELFTDDAVYVDPAWGRVEGVAGIREFMVESMQGLDDWRFPIEFTAIDGDHVVIKWTQILPGTRPDGSALTQSGVSTLVYAGNGRFRYGEDLLNMVHVLEDLKHSSWQPVSGYGPPPQPDRNFTVPA